MRALVGRRGEGLGEEGRGMEGVRNMKLACHMTQLVCHMTKAGGRGWRGRNSGARNGCVGQWGRERKKRKREGIEW